jgi:hypothetical protein
MRQKEVDRDTERPKTEIGKQMTRGRRQSDQRQSEGHTERRDRETKRPETLRGKQSQETERPETEIQRETRDRVRDT